MTMADTAVFSPGGYRYIPALFQYSGGVAAEPGFELQRARFRRPVPLQTAFLAIEAHLATAGRPLTAFAQCELRSPAPFSDQGFVDFNKHYVGTLERWGLYKASANQAGTNPVARTNVCPMYNEPAEPCMHAFTYTVPTTEPPTGGRASTPAATRPASFVLSGGGDARPGPEPYRERIVRYGDTSPEALREKVLFVIGEMARRLTLLGLSWADATSTQAYTVQNIGHLVGPELARRGAMPGGLVWGYDRPPVIGLEFEMDVRAVARELVL